MKTAQTASVILCTLASTLNAGVILDHQLIPADSGAGDYFGRIVDLDNGIAAVSSIYNDAEGYPNAGTVYIFNANTGEEIAKLWIPVTTQSPYAQRFGTALAVDQNLVLIGRESDRNVNGYAAGAAYVFNTQGTPLRQLLAPDGQAYDGFGDAVALDGSHALISDKRRTAFLYDLNTNADPITFTVPDRDNGWGDTFGEKVAVLNNTILISAPEDDQAATKAGAVYQFDTNGNFIRKLFSPNPGVSQDFGHAIALGNGVALIGQYGDNTIDISTGAAYLYDTNTGDLLQSFYAPDADSVDQFGISVDIDGNIAIIGAWHDELEQGVDNAGSAYLFDINTGAFLAKVTEPQPGIRNQFGYNVAISNGQALVGSFGYDNDSLTSGNDAGAAYLFSYTIPEPASALILLLPLTLLNRR